MADDFVTKKAKEQLFPKPGAQRAATIDRRSSASVGASMRSNVGRRMTDQPHVKAFDRAERTLPGSAARSETNIVSAPLKPRVKSEPRLWQKATGSIPRKAETIGAEAGILRKAGRLGKIAAAGVGAYMAYKAWKGE